jgi:hypothetical protein
MKTIEKLERALNQRREHVTLCLVLIFILAYAFGCKKEVEAIPAEEMYPEAAEAKYIPEWVPEGANPEVRYYYLPAAEVYYDTYVGQYVYFKGGKWIYGAHLPRVHASLDLYTTPVIFLSIGVVHPWLRHNFYVTHYHHKHMPKGWGVYGHGHPSRYFDENGKHPYPKNGFYPGGGPKKHGEPYPMGGKPKAKPYDNGRPHSPFSPSPKDRKMDGGHHPSSNPSQFPNIKSKNMKTSSGGSAHGSGGQMAPSHSKPSQGGTKGGKGGKSK